MRAGGSQCFRRRGPIACLQFFEDSQEPLDVVLRPRVDQIEIECAERRAVQDGANSPYHDEINSMFA